MENMTRHDENPMKSVPEVTGNHRKHDRGEAKPHRIPAGGDAEPLQNTWESLVIAVKHCRKRKRRLLPCRSACQEALRGLRMDEQRCRIQDIPKKFRLGNCSKTAPQA